MSAAAAPWSARAAMRKPMLGASALATEKIPKAERPSAKMRRWP